jgi:hypothetical protein
VLGRAERGGGFVRMLEISHLAPFHDAACNMIDLARGMGAWPHIGAAIPSRCCDLRPEANENYPNQTTPDRDRRTRRPPFSSKGTRPG